MLLYLWLSRRASLPFLQEIIPRGDILGRHSISTSPPCRARVWLRTALDEKSGATAAQGERHPPGFRLSKNRGEREKKDRKKEGREKKIKKRKRGKKLKTKIAHRASPVKAAHQISLRSCFDHQHQSGMLHTVPQHKLTC